MGLFGKAKNKDKSIIKREVTSDGLGVEHISHNTGNRFGFQETQIQVYDFRSLPTLGLKTEEFLAQQREALINSNDTELYGRVQHFVNGEPVRVDERERRR